MATQLGLYNDALLAIGERKLASLTENREPRRVLDDAWGNTVRYCLEQGHWKFAQRATVMGADISIVPVFGYPNAFPKPDDCVTLSKVCTDEFFKSPLLEYSEEAGTWYANVDTIYISYVSDDAAFGGDLSLWPETFSEYVSTHLAAKVCRRLTQNATKEKDLEDSEKSFLARAKSKDAMQGPTVFLPTGSWVKTRAGSRIGERGNRSSLIG